MRAVASTVVLTEAEWRQREVSHRARVEPWLAPRLERRRRGGRHPVDDFLFDYYPFRPAQLAAWHPGDGVVLAGDASEHLARRHYVATEAGVTVGASARQHHAARLRMVERILSGTSRRPPAVGCFGLHEWAMVLGQSQDDVRHRTWPLRVSPEQVRTTVDEVGLRCTHFDAFRFFTDEAAALNAGCPTANGRADQEQPGCLHATMDLYKWSAMLLPLTSSDLVADCFELAREVRDLDMRAAPYDFRGLGYQPVRVETASGRSEFAAAQLEFAERGAALRERLLTVVRALTPVTTW